MELRKRSEFQYPTVQFGPVKFHYTPRVRIAFSAAGVVTLWWTGGQWFLSQFTQARGIVDLAYSRVMLGGLWVVGSLMFFVVAGQLWRKRIAIPVSLTVPLLIVVGLDKWAPKPQAGPLISKQEPVLNILLNNLPLDGQTVSWRIDFARSQFFRYINSIYIPDFQIHVDRSRVHVRPHLYLSEDGFVGQGVWIKAHSDKGQFAAHFYSQDIILKERESLDLSELILVKDRGEPWQQDTVNAELDLYGAGKPFVAHFTVNTIPLKERATLLVNYLHDFTNECRAQYDQRRIKLFPGNSAEIKERAEFETETRTRFTDLDRLLGGIIDQFSRNGANTATIREHRSLVEEGHQQGSACSYIATGITAELERLMAR